VAEAFTGVFVAHNVMSFVDTSLNDISDINEQWNNVQYAIKLAAKDNILQ